MSIQTWTNASTMSVDVSGTKFAYRQLGADSGVPVIFWPRNWTGGIRESSTALHPDAA